MKATIGTNFGHFQKDVCVVAYARRVPTAALLVMPPGVSAEPPAPVRKFDQHR